jgi:hypothetical protein
LKTPKSLTEADVNYLLEQIRLNNTKGEFPLHVTTPGPTSTLRTILPEGSVKFISGAFVLSVCQLSSGAVLHSGLG